MQTQTIDGRKIRDEILENVKRGVSLLSFQPVFCDVLVGDNKVSAQYVRMKAKTAEECGICFHHAEFPESITTENLVEEIKKLNDIPNMCGVIVQLPLPKHLDRQAIMNAIDPKLDVDCLGQILSNEFYSKETLIGYPTALACVHILDSLNLDLSNKKILVRGQGDLVGRPVTHILRTRGLNVDIINRETENKDEFIKNADIIISGTGLGQSLHGSMVKEGVVVIDAGTSESKGGVVGDVDSLSMNGVASAISPVPGGVGPVTVAMLLKNVLTVAQSR